MGRHGTVAILTNRGSVFVKRGGSWKEVRESQAVDLMVLPRHKETLVKQEQLVPQEQLEQQELEYLMLL